MDVRILVIDDNAKTLHFIESVLKTNGYEVVTALSGESAFKAINIQRPDLIVSDLEMPEMDGFMFYKKLKDDPLISDIPFMIMTEREKMEDPFRVLGVNGFIVKPFRPDDLVAKVRSILLIDDNGKPFGKERENTPPPKIFVIGTEKFILDEMTHHAQNAGYTIVTTLSQDETIDAAIKFQPDIIFCDVQLKDISPRPIVSDLRQTPQIAKTPIIGYCYYALDKLKEAQVRQNILGIYDASKKILLCGATGYMGRYNHLLFIRTMMKYLKKTSSHRRKVISSLDGGRSMNKLEELLFIPDAEERHKALVTYAKSLNADPLKARDHHGEYSEEKLAILIFDAYHKRQKSRVYDVSFFMMGILVGAGLIASIRTFPQLTSVFQEAENMTALEGNVAQGYDGEGLPIITGELSALHDPIYMEYGEHNTLLREYYYKDGEIIELDKDDEQENMIIRRTFSEE